MNKASKKRLEGRVAIVTGAGRGLGRAEALQLAALGAKVVVNDLGTQVSGDGARQDVAQDVVDEIRAQGGEAEPNRDNIATMAGGEALIETAMDAYGRMDILVNNAGIARPKVIYEMTEDDWDLVIAVHLKGHFSTVRAVSPIFREQKSGVIINTASTSGLGHYGNSSYSAAKEGIVGFTRTISRDLAEFGVRCNAVRPFGMTRLGTPEMMETIRYSQEVLGIPGNGSQWIQAPAEIPTPEQVGIFVAWLCTDAASNVNGRTFFVGGGTVGLYPEPELVRSMHEPRGWTVDSLDADAARSYLIGDLTDMFTGRKSKAA